MQQTEGRAGQVAQAGRKNHTEFWWVNLLYKWIPVTARSNACVDGRSLAEIVSSNTAGGMAICLSWMRCCQVHVSASGWSLLQRSSTDCAASSKCDCEALSWETMARNQVEKTLGGGGAAVFKKPRLVKQEEKCTDSYGVCARNLLWWYWFRIAFKVELYNFGIAGVKILAY